MVHADNVNDRVVTRLAEEAAARVAELRAALATRRVDLPLRYWRQQAHLTTPADNPALARKAVESGTEPTSRLLERWHITADQLADRLGIDVTAVENLLERPRRAPLVMLDGEDSTALGEHGTAAARRTAVETLRGAEWGSTLRFYRPPGFGLPTSAAELVGVLSEIASSDPGAYPLDGIIFPKLEHPEEVDLLYEILSDIERALGLPEGRIRVGFLVESGSCAARLPKIVERATSRIASLIFGVADYSADLGLPAIALDHPLAEWARAEIVNLAGSVGVPALDAMTLAYPVPDPSLDADANRERLLARLALCFRDARRARDLGMSGKWVGHPAQLFVTMLAFEPDTDDPALEDAARAIDVYRHAVNEDRRGATMIAGTMADRATDRHARALLRRAVALGHFDVQRGLALGVVSADEVAALSTDDVIAGQRPVASR